MLDDQHKDVEAEGRQEWCFSAGSVVYPREAHRGDNQSVYGLPR